MAEVLISNLERDGDATRYATGYAAPPGDAVDENLDLVRQGYVALTSEDIPGLALVGPDVVQHVPGSSGVKDGKVTDLLELHSDLAGDAAFLA